MLTLYSIISIFCSSELILAAVFILSRLKFYVSIWRVFSIWLMRFSDLSEMLELKLSLEGNSTVEL